MDLINPSKSTSCQNGFTLVELLVSMFLTLFVMGVIYGIFRVQARTVKSQESRQEAQEYARTVLDMMVREIRTAGYAPSGAACAGIETASAQTFRFRLDADNDGDCGGPNEEITYAYDAGTQNITRAADGGAALSLTDGNATTLQFVYFPQNCANNFSAPVGGGAAACPGTPGGNTGTAAAIQRISISLTARSLSPDTEFGGGQLSAEMTSSVDLRNRGLPP